MSDKKTGELQEKWDRLLVDNWGFHENRDIGDLVGIFFKGIKQVKRYQGKPYQQMIDMGLRRVPMPWEYRLKVMQYIGFRSMQANSYLLSTGDKEKFLNNINLFKWIKPKEGSVKKRKPKFVNVVVKARDLSKASDWKTVK